MDSNFFKFYIQICMTKLKMSFLFDNDIMILLVIHTSLQIARIQCILLYFQCLSYSEKKANKSILHLF